MSLSMWSFSGRLVKGFLPKDRDFNLDDIILNPVNDIFIDAHFIGKPMGRQAMSPGIIKDFPVPFGDFIPIPFMESP